MCGFAGFVAASPQPADELVTSVRRMAATLVHRGPDDASEWVDAAASIAFGFRRLSIVDLSPAGRQPMTSASGRYVGMLNGEIYNHLELRGALEAEGRAPVFCGHSDTEVMLAAIEAWGIEGALERFNGMWALAIWDRHDRRLTLVRDRLGVKPLYYGFAGGTFLFGSELKALARHHEFRAPIDRGAVQMLLRFTYIPAPWTIYDGVAKLLPGTLLTLDACTRRVTVAAYWSMLEAAAAGTAHRFAGDDEDAANEVERLLRDSVRLRMVADVPVGVFLSGGVDSPLVTALMQAQSSRPVRSFSIGLEDADYDEAPHARAIAAHLGTEHTEMYVSPAEALAVIPSLASMYDEPFGDSSQIPTHLVSKVARRSVTVSLSGDGGDELFGGYVRYQMARRFAALARVPAPIRRALGDAITAVPAAGWDRWIRRLNALLPLLHGSAGTGDRLQKAGRVLASRDPDAMYFALVSHWADVVIGAGTPVAGIDDRSQWPTTADPVERMMYFDQVSYLPDDILVKLDRASMAASLEAREPLLDYRLAELSWSLPPSMKVNGHMSKPILRRVLHRYVPPDLINRTKMGFALPMARWLRGPLRDWAEALLDPARLRQEGLLDPGPIRAIWEQHVRGERDWPFHLWGVLMLQAWLGEQRGEVVLNPRP